MASFHVRILTNIRVLIFIGARIRTIIRKSRITEYSTIRKITQINYSNDYSDVFVLAQL